MMKGKTAAEGQMGRSVDRIRARMRALKSRTDGLLREQCARLQALDTVTT